MRIRIFILSPKGMDLYRANSFDAEFALRQPGGGQLLLDFHGGQEEVKKKGDETLAQLPPEAWRQIFCLEYDDEGYITDFY